ncbi:hypothetical protein BT96DRAFT_505094 [Gymnopus androsaceus JB14]|uniref:Uncharacterized protein n=1 Tax=Gymnopus androsaceus JB14 TaxID=1447944 RepID=A0A6A4HY39_9AGAR|nr:hypothetical protein BT96DRAFT_505094 [Gymnopus androsaceus JB14]
MFFENLEVQARDLPSASSIVLTRRADTIPSVASSAPPLSPSSAQDPFRARMEATLLGKLFVSLINGQMKVHRRSSTPPSQVALSAFRRRRLAVLMCMSKMAVSVSAVSILFQGLSLVLNSKIST